MLLLYAANAIDSSHYLISTEPLPGAEVAALFLISGLLKSGGKVEPYTVIAQPQATRNQVTLPRLKEFTLTDRTGTTLGVNTYCYRNATTRDRLVGSRSACPRTPVLAFQTAR